MGLFNKKQTEPVFLKEDSDAERELEVLKALAPNLNQEGKELLAQHIRTVEAGIEGEKRIAFELKNSHMPIYVLHDLYLEDGDLSAQIDYMIFTRKICFVVECKNLYGNIEIDYEGNFIRTVKYGKYFNKERIYSPITQNQRHLELLKKILKGQKGILLRMFFDSVFVSSYIPVVVLANSKSVLNARYAKKEIKQQVIYVDQLIQYMKDTYNKSDTMIFNDKDMRVWAESFLLMHKPVEKDYVARYDQYIVKPEDNTTKEGDANKEAKTQVSVDIPENIRKTESDKKVSKPETIEVKKKRLEDTQVFAALKEWRLNRAREERIKAYYIFNDAQLLDLLQKNPKTKDELLKVTGFGSIKVEKYGEDVLGILEKYRK